ncbi:hypothetical protein CTAYLR_005707 [Chrysophaeum taylorii]|uniref:Elongation factor Tu, chloroplastic n=1 Tax=Chrysophaeum taylorii TaxID=2483200 RepID=A0AAD7UBX6_9STRA|nr:hypothetical protein CTAYLR_005707 [Chrysophaeum taylorii]
MIFPINVNVGVMGHVDSGKTSLVKALSTTLSTAALDKHPQSQQRGITIDLGFSAFSVPWGDRELQFTLVDCPGHASLIRTIIGGAQIIDMMLLVVDCVKGIQTQTAECLVIGEITTDDLVVVLNKIDSLPEFEREERLEKQTRRIKNQLPLKFKEAPIVRVAAAVGGEKVAAGEKKNETWGLDGLVETLKATTKVPERDTAGPFFFAIDHCFPIKGQGTVVTGTCLRGSINVNQAVELPELGVEKKVKSIQMFKKPVKKIECGDRAGVCLAQLDATLVERGILAAPGSVPYLSSAMARVEKVRFFRGGCVTGTKFHVTVGHATVLATCHFFGKPPFDPNVEYAYQDELDHHHHLEVGLCYLKFEHRIRCHLDALVVGSRLDGPENHCRIAFHGHLVSRCDDPSVLRVYKIKQKEGVVARIDKNIVVGKDLFSTNVPMQQFVGLKLQCETGQIGSIVSSFGKSGKFRVAFDDDLDLRRVKVGHKLFLRFKRYVFAANSKDMHQDDDCFFHVEEVEEEEEEEEDVRLLPKKKEEEGKPTTKTGAVERLKGEPRQDGRYAIIIAQGFFAPEDDQRPFAGFEVTAANGDRGRLGGPFGKAGKAKVLFDDGTASKVGDALTLSVVHHS